MVRPLIGRQLGGATLTERDERSGVGLPVWDPTALLRDLELRVGIPVVTSHDALRIDDWSRRLATLLADEPFYASSYRVAPLDTAEMLLDWRDALVDGGWDGGAIPDGGARLATFVALEETAMPLRPGPADRLAAVEAAVALRSDTPYPELTFADEPACWPGRWRRVIAALRDRGTVLTTHPGLGNVEATDSDLGRLQALIASGATASAPVTLRGDGTLVLLRPRTDHDGADAIAGLLGSSSQSTAVIRGGESGVLDDALRRHGVPTLGGRSTSPWRPALLMLPLAIELVFEPLDPRCALELLGLLVNPFAPVARHMLARALCDSPGIGDVRWSNAKQRLEAFLTSRGAKDAPEAARQELATVASWLEAPRHDARIGAPRDVLVAVALRVQDVLQARLASDATPALAAAFEQCAAFAEIVERDARPRLDLASVRQLLAIVGSGGASFDRAEEAGRCDHVDHPGGLLRARDLVVWWYFTSSSARPPHRMRWRRAEIDALGAAGVVLPDPLALLAEESDHGRRAVLAARGRLLLVAPETSRGERMHPHPLWDEVVARLRLTERETAHITWSVDDLVARFGGSLRTERLPTLALPEARTGWRVAAGTVPTPAQLTASAMQELLECPLRWVLARGAGLGVASVPSLPEGPLLHGILGHRLVQALAPTLPSATHADVQATIDRLLPGVAASLLRPGMTFELHQLRHQLARAIESLVDVLHDAELTIAGVEEEFDAEWLGVRLVGRFDLRLRDDADGDVILDLKWGTTTYRERLRQGRAVQLAVYAQARRQASSAPSVPPVAYFSLSRGALLTTAPSSFAAPDGITGPTVEETLGRIAMTLPAVVTTLASGFIPVTGLGRSLPVIDAAGVPKPEQDRHYRCEPGGGCEYCGFGPLCGRAWEGLT